MKQFSNRKNKREANFNERTKYGMENTQTHKHTQPFIERDQTILFMKKIATTTITVAAATTFLSKIN